ncbi:DUF1129 family protein [Lentilactobacillus kisonensis]|uniref:Uncharacterized protein n=2 Tax=Lentilactobacillus kisonensis TaxID=481722 RepID=H1LHU4_9LACO|nr:DUF1129 family protein [Lentilactobacillus kisonensis]EHO50180.1 hypothetical protein HMPREF9104_02185 [Lentilactobacillus kisonensis F0435]KRL20825.1 hypothetical protein FC98_GL001230 [Lentilactobacillus kisonensis DSM 19906 = JCM 15041]
MNSATLITRNNQLREELTSENKKYYEDLMVYIRSKSTFKRESDIEQILFDILTDIIDAQSNGQSARNYFGHDPKTSADAILKSLPRSFAESLKFGLAIIACYVLVFAIPALISPVAGLDLGNLAIMAILGLAFALLVLRLINQSIYQERRAFKILGYGIGMVAFIIISIGGIFIKTPVVLHLNGWIGISVIAALFIFATYLYIKVFHHDLPATIIYAVIGIYALLGIGTRLPVVDEWLTKPLLPKSLFLWIMIPLCIIAALIGGFGTYYLLTKNDTKK